MRRSVFRGRTVSTIDQILDTSNVQIYFNIGYTLIQLSLWVGRAMNKLDST